MKNSYTKHNFIFSIFSLVVSTIQSLWFVPFITQNIGIEAYGYTAVVMTIINFSTVISLAITSMSSRYIAIEMQKKDYKEANRYFNSIFAAVIVITVILFVIFLALSFNINKVMVISSNYINDVGIMMMISGFSFMITVLNTPFLSGLYYSNKLYVMYIFSILNYTSKIAIPILFHHLGFVPIWGMSVGGLIIDIISMFFYLSSYKKYLPNATFNFRLAKLAYIYEVLKSGIWISISKVGSLLSYNIGTYLSNILLGVFITGVYSSILQLQNLISIMVTSISTIFIPHMIQIYATQQNSDLIKYIKQSIRFLSFPLGIISGGFLVFGTDFLSIWIGQSFEEYRLLVWLLIIGLPLTLPAEILNQANITINKVTIPAIITVIVGIVNIILIYIFSSVLKMGITGIALSQLITSTLRGFVFFTMFTSYQLSNRFNIFIKDVLFCPLITSITIIGGSIVSQFFPPVDMITLIVVAFMTTIIVFIFCYFFIFTQYEKKLLKNNLENIFSVKKRG